jgi:hypothetical protein
MSASTLRPFWFQANIRRGNVLLPRQGIVNALYGHGALTEVIRMAKEDWDAELGNLSIYKMNDDVIEGDAVITMTDGKVKHHFHTCDKSKPVPVPSQFGSATLRTIRRY